MGIERRSFLELALAAGAGLAVFFKEIKAFAKGLPSDPGETVKQPAGADEIALPPFDKSSPFKLDEAMLARKTSREFDENAALSKEQLSRLLWAANGINREDGKRTTPSAMARYPVDIYAALKEGVYKYDVKNHKLVKMTGDDVREKVAFQPSIKKSAIKILYVVNTGNADAEGNWMADLEIGCMVQNVYLEAASLGLGTCVFALTSKDKVIGALALKKNQMFRIAQAIGPLKS
jgi:SagB-type dehydrogenase family enzyme